MDPNHHKWSDQQQLLRSALKRPAGHAQALELFLSQHAAIHSARLTPGLAWSFEDESLDGLDESAMRALPPKAEHSIAWILWHLTRCEDITFNLLVAGEDQVLTSGGWLERTGSPLRDTGNTVDAAAAAQFNAAVDLPALRAYRLAVGARTREIVSCLPPGAFQQPVDPARPPRILQEGAVLPEAMGLVEYWGAQTTAGLMLMPATRHPFIHWNEALRVKKAVRVLRQEAAAGSRGRKPRQEAGQRSHE